ncbi:aspartyl-phosphate phosphatase Spo0E family protein [Aquibacillus saliphilus]|uniref:aspartyl-phosphate phosphatase Spo0E family protein n=1 Tax=Aquibacillus saliphilus TaxID=1909422 RepID=UPI001CF0750E|nr:aspartyl-phosphate phosphatase Spo0E family protein [Aquibacillus saliphilus]
MNNKVELEKQIEKLRLKLYEVFQQSSNKEEIISISQLLDEALNSYEKIKDK